MDLQYKNVLSIEINTSRSVLYSNLSASQFEVLRRKKYFKTYYWPKRNWIQINLKIIISGFNTSDYQVFYKN